MSNPLVPILPFVLAAARSFTLGIQSLSGLECQPTISTEAEYELLTIATVCLLGLWATFNLIIRFPDFGALIAEYNQF